MVLAMGGSTIAAVIVATDSQTITELTKHPESEVGRDLLDLCKFFVPHGQGIVHWYFG